MRRYRDPGYYHIVGEDDEFQVALHVLVRAYRDACIAITGQPPNGTHRFENLDLEIEFPDADRTN
jgi:hypothetical protein